MTRIPLSALPGAVLASIVAFSPALAQEMSTKEQWGAFRDFFRERGVLIASQGTVDGGDTLTLSTVRIFSLSDPEAFAIDIPQLQVAQADGLLVLTPSPQFTATARGGGETRVFTINHDGAIQTDASPEQVTLNMDFGTLALAMTSATRGGVALPDSFGVTLGGLDMDITATRAGDADVSLATQTLSYAYDLGQGALDSPFGQSASFEGEGLTLTFTGRQLALLEMLETSETPIDALFDAGVAARLDMRFGPGAGTGRMAIEGMPLTLSTASGAGEMSIGFVDGRFDMNGSVAGVSYSAVEGPVTGTASVETMTFGFGAPLVASPDMQQAYYRIGLDNMVVDSPALALAGLQDFTGEVLNINVDLNADMRILEPLTEDAMERDIPPFDISTVTLAGLLLGVGDASLTGSGAFTFEGGLQASIGAGVPNGTGDFLFELIGGNAFLQRLVSAGIVPQEQMFVAQMMMNGLGQSVGNDHLRSEIAIRPGGVVTVNGAPLPF